MFKIIQLGGFIGFLGPFSSGPKIPLDIAKQVQNLGITVSDDKFSIAVDLFNVLKKLR